MTEKGKIAEEIQKMKGMTWKQRIGYIWDYYKLGFVFLIFLAMLVSLVTTMIRNANTKELMNGIFFNCDYVNGDTEGLVQAFTDSLGGIAKNEKVIIDFTLSEDPNVWNTARTAAETKVTAYNMTGQLDCMVMTEEVYRQYQEIGFFLPLDSWLSAEQLEQWKNLLAWEPVPEDTEAESKADSETESRPDTEAGTEAESRPDIKAGTTDTEAGENHIYGIRLDDSQVLQEYGLYPAGESVYLAIPGNAGHGNCTMEFLKFLLTA